MKLLCLTSASSHKRKRKGKHVASIVLFRSRFSGLWCGICDDRSLSLLEGVARLGYLSFLEGHYKAATGFSEVQLCMIVQIRSLKYNQ